VIINNYFEHIALHIPAVEPDAFGLGFDQNGAGSISAALRAKELVRAKDRLRYFALDATTSAIYPRCRHNLCEIFN
jgi:hypothetical protein